MKINVHDLTHTVAQAAPLLGRAFAGPGGAAVGSLIAAKFGGSPHEMDNLQTLIHADPEAAVKLKQIESEHEVALQQLTLAAANQELQELVHDRASARERETAAANAAGRDKTPAFLAYLLTLGVFAALLGLFCCTVPGSNQSLVLAIVSSLTTVWISAMGYYHGSSIGSKVKEAGLIRYLHTQASGNPEPTKPNAVAKPSL